jgi:glycosyltransferase involved in cell wall biosynthesis
VLSVSRRADLVVLSQGGNFDGLLHGMVCRRRKLPYALVIQKATDIYWPTDSKRRWLRSMYSEARWSFFVSEHNRRLTQEQFALALPRSSVIRNPYLVPATLRTDWPDTAGGLRLACVGRLYAREKGQDLLLRVLARDKWRERALTVTFYGAGDQARGLEEMASFLGLKSVSFAGFVRNVSAIWDTHHGLVLPSRCEGLPLVAVETMLSARVPIVTDVGGARELVEDNLSGFVAAAATEDALDETLERAWQRRDEWRVIGAVAQQRARAAVPVEPEAEFANLLEQLASHSEITTVALEPCQSID